MGRIRWCGQVRDGKDYEFTQRITQVLNSDINATGYTVMKWCPCLFHINLFKYFQTKKSQR